MMLSLINNSSSLSFVIVYAPPIRSSTDSRTDSFSPTILYFSRTLFILGDFNCHHPLWDSKGTSDPGKEEVFNWVISSNLPLNDPDILLFYIAPVAVALFLSSRLLPLLSPSLAPGRCFRTWFDHLLILLTIPLFLVFCSDKRPLLQLSKSLLG